LLALQELKLLKTSPSALQPATLVVVLVPTLVTLHADWVVSHRSGTQAVTKQYQDAGQSLLERHCLHALTEVSQTMPRALQSAFEVQVVRQTLRRQRLLLAPELRWHVVTAAHLLP
jgi:hypothetical protein